tara:strand:- start:7828 stop:8592 length:765 start_codon:yes stop_codon:yes gene_type:complete
MILSNNKFFRALDFSKNNSFSYIFICDHATNIIPKYLKNLGLNDKQLVSHIAWDIGAKEVTIKLAKDLNCPCSFSNFSRLFIDPNRSKRSFESIVSSQEGHNIPGNQNINISDFKNRLNYHNNYHKNLKSFIAKCRERNKKFTLVSVHSFNQKYLNEFRSFDVGILYNSNNVNLALKMFDFFEKNNISYGNNYPYSGFFYNFTLDLHCHNKIENICVELRNDLIMNKKGIDKWSEILKMALNSYDKKQKVKNSN